MGRRGRKTNAIFCSLESRNFVNKTIPKVQQENGNVITTQEEILKEVQHFYSNLYALLNSKTDINDQDILNNLQHPVLTDIESSSLEGKITADEIFKVLRNMKNNKSPGSDGFTVEFFKFFFKDFKHFIKRSINEGYHKGTFSLTQRQGIITSFSKGDKPRQFLKKLASHNSFKCYLHNCFRVYCAKNKICSSKTNIIRSNRVFFIWSIYW